MADKIKKFELKSLNYLNERIDALEELIGAQSGDGSGSGSGTGDSSGSGTGGSSEVPDSDVATSEEVENMLDSVFGD